MPGWPSHFLDPTFWRPILSAVPAVVLQSPGIGCAQVSVDTYHEWIQLVAQFTVTSLNGWVWASGSIHYLLGLWSRLVSSSAYLKGESPSLLETYAPKIIEAYITSRWAELHTGWKCLQLDFQQAAMGVAELHATWPSSNCSTGHPAGNCCILVLKVLLHQLRSTMLQFTPRALQGPWHQQLCVTRAEHPAA